jgi:hypothetical protein
MPKGYIGVIVCLHRLVSSFTEGFAMLRLRRVFTAAFVVAVGSIIYANSDVITDISSYYGFADIEIIKLDTGVENLNIVDLNNDGLNDIVVGNNRKSKIELLIQNKNRTDIVKGKIDVTSTEADINELAETRLFSREELLVTARLANLVTGDLNGDGMVDLAYYGEPKGLYVVLQKSTSSDKQDTLNWQRLEKIKISDGLFGISTLVCEDITGDGRDDLILAARDSIYVIRQNKSGQLGEPLKYATTAQPLAVKVGDIDGDDRKDLILITDDKEQCLHVRFGLAGGQLSPQMRFFIEKPTAITLADYDETKGDEILIIEQASGRLSSYTLSAVTQAAYEDFPVLSYPLEVSNENRKRDLVTGDFDGDGLTDVIISNPDSAEISFYRQNSNSGLEESIRFPAFSDITCMDSFDINGDGKAELAVLSIKENIIGISKYEEGRLTFPKPLETEGEPIGMRLGDMDGDKRIDFACVLRDENDVRSFKVFYNIGNSKHRQASTAVTLQKLLANPDGLKILDVDQDGMNDVLVFQEYEDPILIRQVSRGTFEVVESPKSQASLIKSAAMRSTTTADIDADGQDELLVAQRNFSRSLVFKDGTYWHIIDQYNAKNRDDEILTLGVFDIDGNGKLEILLLEGKKGYLQILKASTDKTYRFDSQLEVNKWNTTKNLKMLFAPLSAGQNSSVVLFDGDKFSVITPTQFAVSDSFAHDIQWLFSYETQIKDGRYGRMAAGDINSDGTDDIVMVEHKKNHIEILALDKSETVFKPISAMRFKVFEEKSYQDSQKRPTVEPREIQIADVTGDGAEDLIIIVHDRIIIYPQDF